MPTLLDLQRLTLSLLNESANSPVGELASGTGSAPVTATSEALTGFLNEAVSTLCRSCYPVGGTGTATLNVGVAQVALANIAVTGGGMLWAARGATWAGNTLTHCDRAVLEIAKNPLTDAAGVPTYWFDDLGSARAIGVYPHPAAMGTLTVSGLIIPVLAAPGEAAPWLSPDLTHLLSEYAAAQIALKNAESPTLAPRASVYLAKFGTMCLRLWEAMDPLTRRAYYPNPPGNSLMTSGGVS